MKFDTNVIVLNKRKKFRTEVINGGVRTHRRVRIWSRWHYTVYSTEWIERLEQWFVANNIEDVTRKRALLLSNWCMWIQIGSLFQTKREDPWSLWWPRRTRGRVPWIWRGCALLCRLHYQQRCGARRSTVSCKISSTKSGPNIGGQCFGEIRPPENARYLRVQRTNDEIFKLANSAGQAQDASIQIRQNLVVKAATSQPKPCLN